MSFSFGKNEKLRQAIEEGDMPKAFKLIGWVDVNARNGLGRTLLHEASASGDDAVHVRLVSNLLYKGGEANAKDGNGYTPLHFASRSGHANVAQALLQEHAKVDAKDETGWTPLHIASRWDHAAVAKVLLPHRKCDPNAKNNDRRTPRDLAKLWSHDVVKVMDGEELRQAAKDGDESKLLVLIAGGADVNARDDYYSGRTPLHEASKFGDAAHIAVIKALVAEGADINAKDMNGSTPVHVASMYGHTAVAEALLANEETAVNAKEIPGCYRLGYTPLHSAVHNGDVAMAEVLLANGADVNAKTKRSGWTPLHIAGARDDAAMAEVLLAKGAEYASSPIGEEDESMNKNELNAKAKSIGWTLLHSAVYYGHGVVVKVLLANGANINAKNEDGWTPLHVAVRRSHPAMAEVLLANGADLNAKDKEGMTPLEYAECWVRCADIIEVLTRPRPK